MLLIAPAERPAARPMEMFPALDWATFVIEPRVTLPLVTLLPPRLTTKVPVLEAFSSEVFVVAA